MTIQTHGKYELLDSPISPSDTVRRVRVFWWIERCVDPDVPNSAEFLSWSATY
jgi:hypothetical protein